jgi:hypothetical protein
VKKLRRSIIIVVIAAMLVSAFPLQVSAQTTSFSFNLIGPNVSVATKTTTGPGFTVVIGSTLTLTGSGTFDTATGAVTGGGSFTEFSPNGAFIDRGTWASSALVTFNPYGGPSPGIQGGLLGLVVKASNGFTAIFQVSCRVNAPAGAPDEGTTIPGLYDGAVSGLTLFHVDT